MRRRLKEYLRFLKSLFMVNCRLLRGMWKLTKLPQPTITVFGGARVPKDSIHSEQAFDIAKKLTIDGFSIITGGGPGIMEAANQGSFQAAKEYGLKKGKKGIRMTSVGISLSSFMREGLNPYIQEKIVMKHFFSRKWLLVRYSVGFVIFPGGFGTLDELFEIVTLEQCYRMPKMPIVLMDKNYWQPILDWARSRALKEGLISEKDLGLIILTDDVDEAVKIIQKYCTGCSMKRPLYTR